MDTLITSVGVAVAGYVPAWVVPALTVAGLFVRFFEKRALRRKLRKGSGPVQNGTN